MQEYCGLIRSSLQVCQKHKGTFLAKTNWSLSFRKPCAELLLLAEELKSVFMKKCQNNRAAAAPQPVESKLLCVFVSLLGFSLLFCQGVEIFCGLLHFNFFLRTVLFIEDFIH